VGSDGGFARVETFEIIFDCQMPIGDCGICAFQAMRS